jgi:hypothetical protein
MFHKKFIYSNRKTNRVVLLFYFQKNILKIVSYFTTIFTHNKLHYFLISGANVASTLEVCTATRILVVFCPYEFVRMFVSLFESYEEIDTRK